MLYMFYITTTPYLPCNNNNINRKELYDFYYTAITLTTGYKYTVEDLRWAWPNRKWAWLNFMILSGKKRCAQCAAQYFVVS